MQFLDFKLLVKMKQYMYFILKALYNEDRNKSLCIQQDQV